MAGTSQGRGKEFFSAAYFSSFPRLFSFSSSICDSSSLASILYFSYPPAPRNVLLKKCVFLNFFLNAELIPDPTFHNSKTGDYVDSLTICSSPMSIDTFDG